MIAWCEQAVVQRFLCRVGAAAWVSCAVQLVVMIERRARQQCEGRPLGATDVSGRYVVCSSMREEVAIEKAAMREARQQCESKPLGTTDVSGLDVVCSSMSEEVATAKAAMREARQQSESESLSTHLMREEVEIDGPVCAMVAVLISRRGWCRIMLREVDIEVLLSASCMFHASLTG